MTNPARAAPGDSSAPTSTATARPKEPQWPAHNAPRVWFLTDGLSPVAIALSRRLLEHGDYVAAGILPQEYNGARGDELRDFMREIAREGAVSVGRGEDMEVDEEQAPAVGDEGEERASDGDVGQEDGFAGAANTKNGKRGKGSDTRRKRWKERFKLVGVDGRNVGQCQAAIADVLSAFSRVDILLICRSEALIGTIEELGQSIRTRSLVRDQFETNFFAAVNIIRALLPSMREKRNGHIIALTGISAHLGTPGLAMYCSSQWALEGYCDSLAYEIAPFNIKMTIVQPNLEIPILTNKITSVPPMAEYSPDLNGAPLSRELFSSLLDKFEEESPVPPAPVTPQGQQDLRSPASVIATSTPTTQSLGDVFTSPVPNNAMHLTQGDLLHASAVSSLFPSLPPALVPLLVAETVFAIAAIGGHNNPPSRHIVGSEGVASVKEKLKTISEELEDFLGVSGAVDIDVGKGGEGDAEGQGQGQG